MKRKSSSILNNIFAIAIGSLLIVFPGFSYAQQSLPVEESPAKSSKFLPSLPKQNDDGIVEEDTEPVSDGYLSPTLKNLAQAYWAVGALDLDDDVAIDNYLLITECPIYQKYFDDDFEWVKIRKATRESIPKNLEKMPTHFAAILPINVGKYDIEKKEFEIEEESKQRNLVRIEIVTNSSNEICNLSGEIDKYPLNIIVILNRPFTLSSIPVDPSLAEIYNSEQRKMRRKIQLANNQNIYRRDAFLRLKFKLIRYKETTRTDGLRAVIYADLDGWDVYGDSNLTQLLYTYEVPKKPLFKDARSSGSNLNGFFKMQSSGNLIAPKKIP